MKKQKFSSMEYDNDKKNAFLESGHVWKEDQDGHIDIFAYETGHHNGPICVKCGYSKCWHCNPNPEKCKSK